MRCVKLAKAIATVAGVGLIPKAPGTFGSLATFPFLFLLGVISSLGWGVIGYIAGGVIILLTYGVGVWATHVYMKHTGEHDPKEVVIDEVIGQHITLVIASPIIIPLTQKPEDSTKMLAWLLLSFMVFRAFDIIKPSFVGWADEKLESAHGVILDDVFAGIFAGISLYAFYVCWLVI